MIPKLPESAADSHTCFALASEALKHLLRLDSHLSAKRTPCRGYVVTITLLASESGTSPDDSDDAGDCNDIMFL